MECRRSRRLQAKQGGSDASGMDVLPDEILQMIFRMLNHGPTLLDVLPLVCKRWCRVARDPASWAGVELVVGDDLVEETRVLLRAPAAKSLTIRSRSVSPPPCSPRLCSALHRSRSMLNTITILETGRWLLLKSDPEHRVKNERIACFLGRQRNLLELRLHLYICDEINLRAVARLRHLRKLELRISGGLRYSGELAGCLPELRELVLHVSGPRDRYFGEPPRGLIGDLVRGATSLRVLDVDLPAPDDRVACTQLRGLEHVGLNVYQDADGHLRIVGEAAVPAVKEAFKFLLQLDTTALRTAAISLCRGEHARHSVAMQGRCNALLQEFAPRIPHVAVEMQLQGESNCVDCAGGEWSFNWCPGSNWPKSDDDWDSSLWDSDSSDYYF